MLKLYNTLSRKKQVFRPRKKKKINIFVCGPTVYDFSHIGHARTYIAFDTIVKYLREKGYKVFYLQNITDIDDKIIKRAKQKKISWKKLANKFEKEYLKDIKSLKIDSVTKYARATDHIKEIISQVKRLIKKGFGYKIEDGIYYDIGRFKDYGKLSGRTATMAEDSVSRIDESKKKRNPGDFCLWKFSKPGEPKWKSPWGWGRPGWHIEDTAITEKYFGPQYDIHGGARDLIFPHHEAEITQMEAISGKSPLVRYWLHTGFLTIEGRKMSKSLGNFITIRELLKKTSPRILRFLVIKTHYRSPINYTKKLLLQTKKEIERIDEFINKIQKQTKRTGAGRVKKNLNSRLILKTNKEFDKAMDDDFNTPLALSSVFRLVNKGNLLLDKGKLTPAGARDILKFFKKIDRIFSLDLVKIKKIKIPQKVRKLVKEREDYRKKKEWKRADKIRKEIKRLGYLIEDIKEGTKIKKA
ncbi:MAG: cysteine--tRNA ligase [Candidatus Nealsonbacteria bacterium]